MRETHAQETDGLKTKTQLNNVPWEETDGLKTKTRLNNAPWGLIESLTPVE